MTEDQQRQLKEYCILFAGNAQRPIAWTARCMDLNLDETTRERIADEICESGEYLKQITHEEGFKDWKIVKNPKYVPPLQIAPIKVELPPKVESWPQKHPVKWAIIGWIGTAVIAAIVGHYTPSKQEKTFQEHRHSQKYIIGITPSHSEGALFDPTAYAKDSLIDTIIENGDTSYIHYIEIPDKGLVGDDTNQRE